MAIASGALLSVSAQAATLPVGSPSPAGNLSSGAKDTSGAKDSPASSAVSNLSSGAKDSLPAANAAASNGIAAPHADVAPTKGSGNTAPAAADVGALGSSTASQADHAITAVREATPPLATVAVDAGAATDGVTAKADSSLAPITGGGPAGPDGAVAAASGTGSGVSGLVNAPAKLVDRTLAPVTSNQGDPPGGAVGDVIDSATGPMDSTSQLTRSFATLAGGAGGQPPSAGGTVSRPPGPGGFGPAAPSRDRPSPALPKAQGPSRPAQSSDESSKAARFVAPLGGPPPTASSSTGIPAGSGQAHDGVPPTRTDGAPTGTALPTPPTAGQLRSAAAVTLGASSSTVPASTPKPGSPQTPPSRLPGAASSGSSTGFFFMLFLALVPLLVLWLAGTSSRLRIALATWRPAPLISLLERPG